MNGHAVFAACCQLQAVSVTDSFDADSVIRLSTDSEQALWAGGLANRTRAADPNAHRSWTTMRMRWQPCSANAPDSRWLLIGPCAADSETGAAKLLENEGDVFWAEWCGDRIHAVMIKRVQDPAGGWWQYIAVQHVASGRRIGNPIILYTSAVRRDRHIEDMQTTLISFKADRLLVLGSNDVRLHELPSLRRVA